MTNVTHCTGTTGNAADEGSSSTFIRPLSPVNTSGTTA